MSEPDGLRWDSLAFAGAMGVCCLGTAALIGATAVSAGSAAGVTVGGRPVGGLGGLLVTVVTTGLALLGVGGILRRRGHHG